MKATTKTSEKAAVRGAAVSLGPDERPVDDEGAEPIAQVGEAELCTARRIWSSRFGGADLQNGYGSAGATLVVDSAGNAILGGDFKGTVGFGGPPFTSAGGSSDLFLAKFDDLGRLLWSKHVGDEELQVFESVAVDDAGNVLCAGVFQGNIDFGGGPLTSSGGTDVFLVKLDAAGNEVWKKRFGSSSTVQWANSVAADRDGNVLLFGTMEGTVDFGGLSLTTGGVFPFIVKFGPSGVPIWGKTFGGSVDQTPLQITTDHDGNVFVAEEAKHSLIDGVRLTGRAFSNALVAKFSPTGELRWAKIFRESGDPVNTDTFPSAMSVDLAGNLFFAGSFEGVIDFGSGPLAAPSSGSAAFLVKLAPDGRAVWSRAFSNVEITSIDPDACHPNGVGQVLITGAFSETTSFGGRPLTSAGSTDIFVARLRKTNGGHLASRRFGSAASQRATGIAMSRGHDVLLTGVFDGTVDFGSGPLTSASGQDLFLARITR